MLYKSKNLCTLPEITIESQYKINSSQRPMDSYHQYSEKLLSGYPKILAMRFLNLTSLSIAKRQL